MKLLISLVTLFISVSSFASTQIVCDIRQDLATKPAYAPVQYIFNANDKGEIRKVKSVISAEHPTYIIDLINIDESAPAVCRGEGSLNNSNGPLQMSFDGYCSYIHSPSGGEVRTVVVSYDGKQGTLTIDRRVDRRTSHSEAIIENCKQL
ncbi:hypothetical protein [Bdellovibrio sp. HCB288]|uniref:hypothetical protein n=1 Tax=Bdellovibrio sp. HCB288 TaxID=3394355 RepID=UPI0039B60E1E